jgi:hypothetical protein
MTTSGTAIPRPGNKARRSHKYLSDNNLRFDHRGMRKQYAASCTSAPRFSWVLEALVQRLRSTADPNEGVRGRLRARARRQILGLLTALCLTLNAAAQVSDPAPVALSNAKTETSSRARHVPPCSGPPSRFGTAPPKPSPSAHSVTLSWKASVPRSKARKDAIKGYYVYRSLNSHKYSDADRLNPTPLRGTRCIDTDVKPHTTYFYAVKSVSATGTPSDFSSEISVVIPFP